MYKGKSVMKFYDVKKMENWQIEKELGDRYVQLYLFPLSEFQKSQIIKRISVLADEMILREI